MSNQPQLRVGTRGSPLALAQADMVKAALIRTVPALAEPGALDIVVIRTTGDHILDRPLAEVGGKGLFTKEIEEALQAGGIDVAVHSMKDMPTVLPEGLGIGAMLPRADPRDMLIAKGAASLRDLPQGCVLGTASLRRAAQALALRPDLRVTTLRGSVQTRLKRVEEGAVGATLLARAGLERLGLAAESGATLEIDEMLPAVAQGAIGIECRLDDARVLEWLQRIDHLETSLAVEAERAFLAALDGSCRTPIAGYCRPAKGRYLFEGLVARPDGTDVHRGDVTGGAAEMRAEAAALGRAIKGRLDPAYFASI